VAEPRSTCLPEAGYANFISAQKLKIEFSLFNPSINLQLPVEISPEIQERIYGTPR
jgi:hypothetical protein